MKASRQELTKDEKIEMDHLIEKHGILMKDDNKLHEIENLFKDQVDCPPDFNQFFMDNFEDLLA
jgi:hypothetical protein